MFGLSWNGSFIRTSSPVGVLTAVVVGCKVADTGAFTPPKSSLSQSVVRGFKAVP